MFMISADSLKYFDKSDNCDTTFHSDFDYELSVLNPHACTISV